jgi:hypothetical protein
VFQTHQNPAVNTPHISANKKIKNPTTSRGEHIKTSKMKKTNNIHNFDIKNEQTSKMKKQLIFIILDLDEAAVFAHELRARSGTPLQPARLCDGRCRRCLVGARRQADHLAS